MLCFNDLQCFNVIHPCIDRAKPRKWLKFMSLAWRYIFLHVNLQVSASTNWQPGFLHPIPISTNAFRMLCWIQCPLCALTLFVLQYVHIIFSYIPYRSLYIIYTYFSPFLTFSYIPLLLFFVQKSSTSPLCAAIISGVLSANSRRVFFQVSNFFSKTSRPVCKSGCLTPTKSCFNWIGAPTCHHHQVHHCHQSPGMPEQHWVNLGTATTPNHPLGEFPTENTVREVGTTKSCCHLGGFSPQMVKKLASATRPSSTQTLLFSTQNHTLWMQGAQPRWLETTWWLDGKNQLESCSSGDLQFPIVVSLRW